MKKLLYFCLFSFLPLMTMGQGVRVNYKGVRPTIADFVTAVLSQDDLGETLNDVKVNWMKRQQGKPHDRGYKDPGHLIRDPGQRGLGGGRVGNGPDA